MGPLQIFFGASFFLIETSLVHPTSITVYIDVRRFLSNNFFFLGVGKFGLFSYFSSNIYVFFNSTQRTWWLVVSAFHFVISSDLKKLLLPFRVREVCIYYTACNKSCYLSLCSDLKCNHYQHVESLPRHTCKFQQDNVIKIVPDITTLFFCI